MFSRNLSELPGLFCILIRQWSTGIMNWRFSEKRNSSNGKNTSKITFGVSASANCGLMKSAMVKGACCGQL